MEISQNEIVLGQNFVWSATGSLVALIYLIRCLRGEVRGDVFWLALGILLVAGGSSVHRGYWYLGRWFRSHGNYDKWEWFADNAAIGLSPFVIAIVAGYCCHLMPLFNDKKQAAVLLTLGTFLVWLLGIAVGVL